MILPEDIQLYQFLVLLDKFDLLRYGSCSKQLYTLMNQYAYLRIKNHVMRTQRVENEEWIQETLSAFEISSHMKLLLLFWDFQFPFENDYRCLPIGNNYPQGGLLTIRKRYSFIGKLVTDMTKDVMGFTFYLSNRNNSLMAYHMDVSEQRTEYTVSVTQESLLLIPSHNPEDYMEFRIMIPTLNLREIKFPSVDIPSLCGFFVGTYGGHGHEILYVTAHDTNRDKIQLRGLKVTGDKNVPAGEVSFIIDLERTSHPLNPHDMRPIIISNAMGMFFANMEQRLSDAVITCEGRGCINRIPGIWNPEHVPLTFMAYRGGPGSQCAFSLVFEDQSEAYRHGIDFARYTPM